MRRYRKGGKIGMYDFKKYINDKTVLIQKMDDVEKKIKELDSMGIDVTESVKKIENAKKIVLEDRISVVLVGAFSDGKTSVASGWINEKLDNMKIASDESSDEILCYTPSSIPEGCQIVDTPGLFGDKVGEDEEGDQILLSDITKKYISESNLILYVVAAKNPIKDSHKECIKWILKDLNKLSSTIFVINKMDDVADLTDDEEYNLQAKIKTENLRGKLLECGLNNSEVSKVNVACISAAPNGEGIETWKMHRDEYLRRSHMNTLENITNSILQNSRENLIAKTGCDILNDELRKTIEFVREQESLIEEILLPEKKESLKRNKNDLDTLYKRIIRSKTDMIAALTALQKKKISLIRAASMDNFIDVLEDEIGIESKKEGQILERDINNIINEYFDKNESWAKDCGNKFNSEYEKQNEAIDNLLKKGAVGVSNGLKATGQVGVGALKSGIFFGRKMLRNVGIAIKFKPWQVTKIATFATNALPIIGAAIDVVSNVAENIATAERNRKFEESKKNIISEINKMFTQIYDKYKTNELFINNFAPSYKELKEQICQDEQEIKEQELMIEKFKKWTKKIKETDYKIV